MRAMIRWNGTAGSGRYAGACLAGALWMLSLGVPLAAAQGSPDAAHIVSLSGQVSVERSGELWVLNAGQTVAVGQTIVTGADSFATLQLPDGSTLDIFPNSRVLYRPSRFNLRDLLDVYVGKVRLQIQHLLPGETPLRVTSPTAVISVRGTVFEVEVEATQDTTIFVAAGAVSVRHRLFPGAEVLVESGQSVRVAATLPLTAAAKSAVPLRTLGRVVRAVSETLAQINAVRGSASGSGGGSPSPSGGGVSGSDTGSNQPKPPAGEDDHNGNSGGGTTAPPGDVLP